MGAHFERHLGQINVVIHALGILLCLPHILRPGEVIDYVSLGAGNTGRAFDLETSLRIAEFKFIHWQGGPESIRQNSLFKDFYEMAEHETQNRPHNGKVPDARPVKAAHQRAQPGEFTCPSRRLKNW